MLYTQRQILSIWVKLFRYQVPHISINFKVHYITLYGIILPVTPITHTYIRVINIIILNRTYFFLRITVVNWIVTGVNISQDNHLTEEKWQQ